MFMQIPDQRIFRVLTRFVYQYTPALVSRLAGLPIMYYNHMCSAVYFEFNGEKRQISKRRVQYDQQKKNL